jgi:tetratricopeptide (TPR) repeat protein
MRRFFAISASLLLFSSLFLGCTRQAQKKEDDKQEAKIDPPKVKVEPIVKKKVDDFKDKKPSPSDATQEKYDAALDDAIRALAERKWTDALNAFETARSFKDTDFVQAEIAKLKYRIEQDGTAKTTLKNIETVLNDGNAEEAVKLTGAALKEFGDGDDASRLVQLSLQADSLQGVQKKENNDARYNRFRKLAEDALAEKNLRAAALALEQALQARPDDELQKTYDSIRLKLDTYDARRITAAELRRRPEQLEDALAALKDAADAWDTLQIRAEIDECQLALQKRRDTVSVADFDVRNDVGMADAGATLAEEILPRLKAKFDLVERHQLNRVLGELKLQQGFADDLTQQQNLSKLAKVRYLVVGSVGRRAGITVLARLVDLRTGLVVQTAKLVAPTMEEAINLAPELAKQLIMSDEEKMQYDAAAQEAKPAEAAPDNAAVPPAPLPPAADAPAPNPPMVNVPPPQFANVNPDAFKVLAPPPQGFVAAQPEVLVLQRRNRLLFATIEMGDFLFRAGRFGEARRQFEFALLLAPDNPDVQLRLERVRPLTPPVVVVVDNPLFYVKPRIAVLPFLTVGNPFVVPPGLATWTPANLAPYFSSRFEIVDPAEIYWFMGRMGMTMRDLMFDVNARRWLGRAVGARYFVLGSCVETTSFDVNTYLIDAELGYLQGSARINVRNPFELKLRLSELAELTMMTPAERAAVLAGQPRQRFERLLFEGRRHMEERRYREALAEFTQALKIYPNNVQAQVWFLRCQEQVRFLDFEQARRDRYQAEQVPLAAQRQRQLELAHESERARRHAVAVAVGRSDAERRTQLLFRFEARDSLVTRAQIALKTNRFSISVNLFQGAMDLGSGAVVDGPTPVPMPAAVYQDFARARLETERSIQLRDAQWTAAREAALRQNREQQLQETQKQLAAARRRERETLDAVQAAQAERDEQAFRGGLQQGQRFMEQDKYEAALAAFQGAQRLANTPKQNEQVNRYIDIIVQRQAEALAKTQQEKDNIGRKLVAERERRKAAETLAKQNEEQYKLALQAAQQALSAKNLDVAQTKFEAAGRVYKTDAVLTGIQQVQTARAALDDANKKAQADLKKADTLKQLLVDGNAALDAKKYADAAQSFQQAKRLAPDNLDVMTGLTKAEQARDRLLAEERRKAQETGRTQTFQRLVKSGRDNLASKHYEAAVANLSDALKLNPTDMSVQDDLNKAMKGRDALLTDAKAAAAANQRADTYQKLLSEGQVALDSKRYTDAIQKFTEAQKVLPGDKASESLLRDAQAARKAAEDAVATAAKQRADDLKKAADLQQALSQGRAALAGKDLAAARKWLAQAKALGPNNPEVLKASRDLDQAVQRADAEAFAQKQRLQQFQTQLTAGKDALNAKRYPEALKALSSATTLMPENKEAQDLFRSAQTESRLADEAIANDKTQLANYQMALNDGQKALQTKSYDQAIKSFQQALKLMPNDASALKLLQQAQDAQGAAAAAAASFQKAMEAGQAALTKMNFAAAVKSFSDAVKLDPNDARARQLLQKAQQALADAERQARALANYQKAMSAGQTAMTAKRYADAVTAFKEALRLAPNDQKAQTQLQAAQQALQDSGKTKTPDSAKQFNDAMQKAAAAEKGKRYGEAVKAYQDALKLRPKDADAQAGLKQNQFSLHLSNGQQYLDNSMWVAAQGEFEAALRIFPNNDQAKKLLQKAKNKMK